MVVWYLARLLVHLLAGMLICAIVFPFTKAGTQEKIIRRWSRQLIRKCHIELKFIDQSGVGVSNLENPLANQTSTPERALIACNHVSWLDIFVLNALHPCHFVAKSDIRGWPMIGWLSAQAGTIFLERGRQRDVRRIYEGLVEKIHDGKRIAFFPEGTTARQGEVLPFHANLFEAAIEAKVPVQGFSIRYLNTQGQLHPAADFVGDMTIVESMLAIMRGGKFIVELRKLPSLSTEGAHRRDIAVQSRKMVADSLGLE